MRIADILAQIGGVDAIAKNLSVNPQQIELGANVLVPILMEKIKAQMPAQGGMLSGLIGKASEMGVLDKASQSLNQNQSVGNQILQSLFGSPAGSSAVAEDAAQKSGVNTEVLKQLLPLLAMAVTGWLNKENANLESGSAAQGLVAGLGKLFKS